MRQLGEIDLDSALFQPLQCRFGLIAANRDQGLKVADADLADGITRQSGVAGQGAEPLLDRLGL